MFIRGKHLGDWDFDIKSKENELWGCETVQERIHWQDCVATELNFRFNNKKQV
jgi:hypothetical protein